MQSTLPALFSEDPNIYAYVSQEKQYEDGQTGIGPKEKLLVHRILLHPIHHSHTHTHTHTHINIHTLINEEIFLQSGATLYLQSSKSH